MYWRRDEWIMTLFSFLHVNLQATMSRRGKWAKISIRISVEKVRKGGSMWGRQSRVDRFSRHFISCRVKSLSLPSLRSSAQMFPPASTIPVVVQVLVNALGDRVLRNIPRKLL